MFSRAAFILVALFWVTMNVLLWRAEYGRRNLLGGDMPAEVVWQKVLLAQDASPLEIRHHGKRIGFCRWAAGVKQEAVTTGDAAMASPEGMVRKPTGYQIDFDGNVAVGGLPNRLRFDSRAEFSSDQGWQEFHLRLSLHGNACAIHASASAETLRLVFGDEASRVEHVFSFAELQDPQALVRRLADPFSVMVLNAGGLLPGWSDPRALAGGLKCEARNDWIKVGRTSLRAYRLDIHLVDRHRAVVFVSRAGEILRVELPGELTLVNDQMTIF